MKMKRKILKEAKRIVIKVGTSTLTYNSGKTNLFRIDKLALTIADLVNQGREIVLVTSGAIGVGVGKLGLDKKPKTIGEKQAVAAVGQCELTHIYSKFFSEYSHIVGQILLTRDVVENDVRRQNVINTFENLLKRGIIPIVNENDSVSVEEINVGETYSFGENDTLSAIVAQLIGADLLIVLSDIDGFYDGDPRTNKEARLISIIEDITPELEDCAGGVGSQRGTGGMITKISAAKIAVAAGVNMVIANGDDPKIITDIVKCKDIGSLFVAKV